MENRELKLIKILLSMSQETGAILENNIMRMHIESFPANLRNNLGIFCRTKACSVLSIEFATFRDVPKVKPLVLDHLHVLSFENLRCCPNIDHALTSNGLAGGIRGHQRRLTKQMTRIRIRENFLTNRVVKVKERTTNRGHSYHSKARYSIVPRLFSLKN
ncbi:hypothetical protein BpHYR1_046180 [Brachionus plicatilis]|uniref:Uncharacterized protein n=1 Tax=Brachionus plicatilis TaxID=10195 RepID=A0A3M7S3X3_BRAPC|nr:hypothetical protein BpHYR1_046180 [Brachionus plicatilis]